MPLMIVVMIHHVRQKASTPVKIEVGNDDSSLIMNSLPPVALPPSLLPCLNLGLIQGPLIAARQQKVFSSQV